MKKTLLVLSSLLILAPVYADHSADPTTCEKFERTTDRAQREYDSFESRLSQAQTRIAVISTTIGSVERRRTLLQSNLSRYKAKKRKYKTELANAPAALRTAKASLAIQAPKYRAAKTLLAQYKRKLDRLDDQDREAEEKRFKKNVYKPQKRKVKRLEDIVEDLREDRDDAQEFINKNPAKIAEKSRQIRATERSLSSLQNVSDLRAERRGLEALLFDSAAEKSRLERKVEAAQREKRICLRSEVTLPTIKKVMREVGQVGCDNYLRKDFYGQSYQRRRQRAQDEVLQSVCSL
ncbi:MAG: hypothetical protein HOE90_07530 [Bacteriovoracaceae bacterium]|jgi:chromosome segregation ATPase|nr:hypothetical protein [Bacteriovoracaceae bacterium]